jgi:hypothetical protein
MQVVCPVVDENRPAGQFRQLAAPVTSLKVPAAQSMQLAEPETENLPAAQSTQVV